MLETDLILTCPVCSHPDKDLINSELILEGDLEKISRRFSFDYDIMQDHAQHVDLDEIVPTASAIDDAIGLLKKRLNATSNPADIVYIMTLIMKTRVSPLLHDDSAAGLSQLDKINKALRENAGVIAKLREQMREGDAKKIEQLTNMVSIYRGVLLDLCTNCNSSLRTKIDQAVASVEQIEEDIATASSFEAPKEDLPEIPSPLES